MCTLLGFHKDIFNKKHCPHYIEVNTITSRKKIHEKRLQFIRDRHEKS